MRGRTWPVFVIGIGAMLLLIFLPGIAALRQSARIYDEVRVMQRSHEQAQDALFDIERRILQTSVATREFLLDSSPETAYVYKERVVKARMAIEADLIVLTRMVAREQVGIFDQLRRQLQDYWSTVTPVFDWPPAERSSRATYFLREQQRPRREGLLAIAEEISRLSRENYRARYEDVNASQRRYRDQLELAIGVAFLLGVAVAAGTIWRISRLERHNEQQRLVTLQAEQQMRNLSASLMHAQEEERRTIARELHDEVGQMLTGLRMELATLNKFCPQPDSEFQQRLQEAKSLTEQTMRTVRELAVGLRPSVLDLGLEAALQWQVRHFARRTGTEASVDVDPSLPPLPEAYLTCIYRIVQEALTNSARHSSANRVRVTVAVEERELTVTVSDDGIGMPADWRTRRGLGLVGMEERARELGGTFSVNGQSPKGASLQIQLPLPAGVQS